MGGNMEINNTELLEISVKIEQEGQAFYKEVANHISDPVVKPFLLLMAKDEAEHEKHFKEIFENKEGQKYGWENNTALRELIDDHIKPLIFPKVDEIFEKLPEFDGIQKALDFALKSEELAIEFYATLRKNCDNFETKCLLSELESEEKSHRQFIQKLIQGLESESE